MWGETLFGEKVSPHNRFQSQVDMLFKMCYNVVAGQNFVASVFVFVGKKRIRMQNFATKDNDLMHYFTKNIPVSFDTSALYGKRTLGNLLRLNTVLTKFKHAFHVDGGYIASSPGRVEIVGNHTDHNGGRVVGCTVNLDIVAAFRANDKPVVCIKNPGRADIVFDLAESGNVELGSKGMVKGVIAYLASHGYKVGGLLAYVQSDVPSGAGISSGAAFQLLVGTMISALYNDNAIPAEVLARAGQYAENVYFGKPCGLLDQSVIAVGGMVRLDFSDGVTYLRTDPKLPDLDIVLVDTGGSHASLTGYYAAIPDDMRRVAEYFGKTRLCDVDSTDFYSAYTSVVSAVGERAALRAGHFFEENLRVDNLWQALQRNDETAFVNIVNASGDSSSKQLQNCAYGANTTIDDAVTFARSILRGGAARVHGGGFAGTILCIVPKKQTTVFCAEMALKYGATKVHRLAPRSCGAVVL